MNTILTIIVVVIMFSAVAVSDFPLGLNSGHLNKSACPLTRYGKKEPSQESNLHACKNYMCDSCCFPNITSELAHMPLGQVGGLNYDQCSDEMPMSHACSIDTTYIQCMYQCSPNLFPWISPVTRKLTHLPICASFCDAWFAACQHDLTCVVGKGNWQTDLYWGFDADGTPKAPCKEPKSCRNFTTVYGTGENMCNSVWGDLFVYTPDTQPCLNPAKPEDNTKTVQDMNAAYQASECITSTVNYTDVGLIVGVVFGVLAGIFLIVAGVFFYLRKKKEKDSPPAPGKPKTKEPGAPEEMANLKSSTTAKPPTPSNTAGHSDSDVEEA